MTYFPKINCIAQLLLSLSHTSPTFHILNLAPMYLIFSVPIIVVLIQTFINCLEQWQHLSTSLFLHSLFQVQDIFCSVDRLICLKWKMDYITLPLNTFQWYPTSYKIKFKALSKALDVLHHFCLAYTFIFILFYSFHNEFLAIPELC